MKRRTGSLLAFFVVLFLVSVGPSVAQTQDRPMDRTVLPIKEPTYPPITVLDVRDAKAPPLFQVKAPQGAPNVYIYYADRKRVYARRIEVGPAIGGEVEVRSGLNCDEQIVVAGQQKLREGTPVQIVGGVQ